MAKSVIKIAKRDEIDKFVQYENPLSCEVTGDRTKRVEFRLDLKMYNIYMNIINKAFEDG